MRPALAVISAVLLAACSFAAGGAQEGTKAGAEERLPLRLVEVASGLDSPVHLTATPSQPNRLYVVEQEGRIRILVKGRVRPEPFLDIVDLVRSGGEQGLLSVAFHPNHAKNRLFYVDYTDRNGDTRVVEYRSDGERALAGARRELLFVDQPYANHNGGQLAFGPDGFLYVGMGDGGSQGDPEARAQNLSTRLGKLLRLDVSRAGAKWEMIAYGLRNPWRFSFDRKTGDLYIADVGQNEWEEIDFLPRQSHSLVNFGWDVFEGRERYEDKRPNQRGRLVGPIAVYSHSHGCSVTGGFVYRGSSMPALRGRYFYGDYCSGNVWSLRVRGGKASGIRREAFRVDLLTSFGEDARGELYLVSHRGVIYRLAS